VPDQNPLTPRGWQRAANGRENASTSSFALIVSTLPLPGHFRPLVPAMLNGNGSTPI
jgi:hypothetical protein